jgi:hypothetical protein
VSCDNVGFDHESQSLIVNRRRQFRTDLAEEDSASALIHRADDARQRRTRHVTKHKLLDRCPAKRFGNPSNIYARNFPARSRGSAIVTAYRLALETAGPGYYDAVVIARAAGFRMSGRIPHAAIVPFPDNRSEPAKTERPKYPEKSLPDNNSSADGGKR